MRNARGALLLLSALAGCADDSSGTSATDGGRPADLSMACRVDRDCGVDALCAAGLCVPFRPVAGFDFAMPRCDADSDCDATTPFCLPSRFCGLCALGGEGCGAGRHCHFFPQGGSSCRGGCDDEDAPCGPPDGGVSCCSGLCVLDEDPWRCGSCGMACGGNRPCVARRCDQTRCRPGTADCDGVGLECEVVTAFDPRNCGACGRICPRNAPSCLDGQCAVGPAALVAGAPTDGSWLADVRLQLLATGSFSAVDTVNLRHETPTLDALKRHDVALVFSDWTIADPVTLGDRLADYFDAGGRVVLAPFANLTVPVTGRFGDPANGYLLLRPGGQRADSSFLGSSQDPESPLLVGVNRFFARVAYRGGGEVVVGATVVARWWDGQPLLVRGMVHGRPRVDLNFFPVSSAKRAGFWEGDGAALLRNALLFR